MQAKTLLGPTSCFFAILNTLQDRNDSNMQKNTHCRHKSSVWLIFLSHCITRLTLNFYQSQLSNHQVTTQFNSTELHSLHHQWSPRLWRCWKRQPHIINHVSACNFGVYSLMRSWWFENLSNIPPKVISTFLAGFQQGVCSIFCIGAWHFSPS